MDLTFNDIKKITFGAVNSFEEGGLHFRKCTEKQIAVWYSASKTLGDRAKATTGIRLDFMTDSSFLEFSAIKGNNFEVHIDGLFRRLFLMNELRERGETARFSICDPLGKPYKKGEKHRVTLLFPFHDEGILGHVALEDGSCLEPYSYDMKILFIGDSITQGWDSGYDSMGFAPRVANFFNADYINQGIGGSVFNADAFDTLAFDPDVTVVAYGTNDWDKINSARELTERASAHLSLIKEAFGGKEKKIFAISPIWRDSHSPRPMGSFTDCRSAVIKAIESVGAIHIDGLSLVPPYPELYADKYLHPNALGFSFYAENLIKQMQKHI